ncbi:MAG: sigma-54-dependent Fis family transcriptional regulator [Myxococcales bacterium]|nr:sigma-54-dependent Fis family transcriptional regulator [Myxococcales bacterium]
MSLQLLLVDDEPTIRLTLGDALADAGYEVTLAADGAEGLASARAGAFDVVISDIRLPKLDGLSLFETLRVESPETDVILITAYGDVADAVAALKSGAADYLTKPFEHDEILLRLRRIAERRQLGAELRAARAALAEHQPDEIIGRSPPMQRLKKLIATVGRSDASVVITGESGTGKELVARALHARSPRAAKPFVAVNCAAFPETLIEAELFGHEKGAFTGATTRREGRFQAAHGGTLLLDEVGEIPLTVQAKLLRVLQEGVIEPLGAGKPVAVDVRVLSATHRDLKAMIAERSFREDLYFRLKVLELEVPPLRDRQSDLPLLVEHFLQAQSGATRDALPRLTPRAWTALSAYGFPGNVRELEHAVRHGLVLASGGAIDAPHLPADIVGELSGDLDAADVSDAGLDVEPLKKALERFERTYLERVLAHADGKKTRAAELLGISRKTLWEKLKAYELDGGS